MNFNGIRGLNFKLGNGDTLVELRADITNPQLNGIYLSTNNGVSYTKIPDENTLAAEIQKAIATIASGLSTPIPLASESLLPDISTVTNWTASRSYSAGDKVVYDHKVYSCLNPNSDADFNPANWKLELQDGTYYSIQDMDKTKPDHTGRAWYNSSIAINKWQTMFDDKETPVEEYATIANNTPVAEGKIITHNHVLYRAKQAFTCTTNFDNDYANLEELKTSGAILNGFEPNRYYAENEMIIEDGTIYTRVAAGISKFTFAQDIGSWKIRSRLPQSDSKYVRFNIPLASFNGATSWKRLTGFSIVDGDPSLLNTSTGEFIVPVDGIYSFNGRLFDGHSDYAGNSCFLCLNDNTTTGAPTNNYRLAGYQSINSGVVKANYATISGMFHLKKGDKVSIKLSVEKPVTSVSPIPFEIILIASDQTNNLIAEASYKKPASLGANATVEFENSTDNLIITNNSIILPADGAFILSGEDLLCNSITTIHDLGISICKNGVRYKTTTVAGRVSVLVYGSCNAILEGKKGDTFTIVASSAPEVTVDSAATNDAKIKLYKLKSVDMRTTPRDIYDEYVANLPAGSTVPTYNEWIKALFQQDALRIKGSVTNVSLNSTAKAIPITYTSGDTTLFSNGVFRAQVSGLYYFRGLLRTSTANNANYRLFLYKGLNINDQLDNSKMVAVSSINIQTSHKDSIETVVWLNANETLMLVGSSTVTATYTSVGDIEFGLIGSGSSAAGGDAIITHLIAVSDTQPATFVVGDKYFNTKTNLVYTAVSTTLFDNGEPPVNKQVFVDKTNKIIYSYVDNKLIKLSTQVSKQTYQAIRELDDGVYVKDLEPLMNKLDLGAKFSEANMGEYFYATYSMSKESGVIAIKDCAPMQDFDYIETNLSIDRYSCNKTGRLNNYIILKAGITYEIDALLLVQGTSMAYYITTDPTSDGTANANKIGSRGHAEASTTNYSDANIHIVYTPTATTKIYFHASTTANQQYFPSCSYISVKALNDKVIDPMNYIDNTESIEGVPVGTVFDLQGNNCPEGYLVCDGSIYNIADYPELAQHIKNSYGSINIFGGDGIKTFGVPSNVDATSLIPVIPKMTSSTAPYGKITSNSEQTSGYPLYQAFDQNSSTAALTGITVGDKYKTPTGENPYIQYEAVDPFNIKKIEIYGCVLYGTNRCKDIRIEASVNGTSFEPITKVTLPNSSVKQTFEINGNKRYRYIRAYVESSYCEEAGLPNHYAIGYPEFQVYGTVGEVKIIKAKKNYTVKVNNSYTEGTTLWEGQWTNTAQNITLSDSIRNYDEIYFEANSINAGTKVILCRTLNVKSILSMPFNSTGIILTEVQDMNYRLKLSFGFADDTHIKFGSVAQAGWARPVLTKVIGYKKAIADVSPLSLYNTYLEQTADNPKKNYEEWCKSICPQTTYSSDEQVIGSWFGKTLYRKTLVYNQASDVSVGAHNKAHGIASIDEVVSSELKAYSGTTLNLVPNGHRDTNYQISAGSITPTNVSYNIGAGFANSPITRIYHILEYTKK